MSPTGVVTLLEVDPDLGSLIDATRRPAARSASNARVLTIDAGPWDPPSAAAPGDLGMFVLRGLVTRTVTVSGRESVELLAQGDLLRPWVRLGPDASITPTVRWDVLDEAELAVLDADFAHRMAEWPEVVATLLERTVMRSRLLAFALAISYVRRVDERLLLLMWHLADRWGRVTPEGVVVPLRLTHRALATLVGAQRPSVSTALGTLKTAGMVERRDDGAWLLRGEPGEVLNRIRAR